MASSKCSPFIWIGDRWEGGTWDASSGLVFWDVESGPVRLETRGADWREWTTLRLRLTCPRRTGARVALDALGARGERLGRVVFAADWVGENDMQLWLAHFDPRGPEERWGNVSALELRCEERGWWPTRLGVGHVSVSRAAPSWQVNESDHILEMGWHWLATGADHWAVQERESHGFTGPPYKRKPWPWLQFGYPQGNDPGKLTLERRWGIDLAGDEQMLAKMAWDKDALLTVTALVDGGRGVPLLQEASAPSAGKIDGWLTFGVPLGGARRLDAVRVTLAEVPNRTADGREIGMGFFWVLLRRPSTLDRTPRKLVRVKLFPSHRPTPARLETMLREVPQVAFEECPESTTPVGDPLEEGLPWGFSVRREGLPALRERALRGPARRIFEGIQAAADDALETDLVDRNYYGSPYGGGIGLPKGLRGAGMRIFGPVTAITHLITGEEKYAVAARRWILRAARSDDWRGDHGGSVDRPEIGEILPYWDSFTGWYPLGFSGYMNHPFKVADVAFGVASSYDMLYHAFGPEERAEVEQAFIDHGVYRLYDTLSHNREFYLSMNQGVLFALPLMMMTAFLQDRDEVFRGIHGWSLEFLREFGERPWSAEGVCGEGPGYGMGTVSEFVEALPAIAACRRKAVSDVVPQGLPRVLEYAMHCRSTWARHDPSFIGLSDGSTGGWISGEVLAFLAQHLGDSAAQYFWEEKYAANPPSNLPSLLFLGDGIRAAEPQLPPAKVFWDQPTAFLRTGWRPGETLMAITNVRQWTGHGHNDRASVVLEFNGEQLLLDPGMIGYSDPSSRQYAETFCHNTLTFSQRSQSAGRRVYETAIAGFLSTSGDRCPGLAGGIDWVVADAGAVYPEARRYRRHVLFLRPGLFVLIDDVEAHKPESTELNFTCLGPIEAEGDTFISTAGTNRLVIYSLATRPLGHERKLWGTHWPEIPSYRLIRSTAQPVPACTFLTLLIPQRLEDILPRVEVLRLPGWLAARVSVGDAHEEVFWRRESGAELLPGVDSDARAMVIRRRGGILAGAALFEGTFLRLEGEGEILRAPSPGLYGIRRDAVVLSSTPHGDPPALPGAAL
ncbi:MAG: heparinase II/III family protein [Planctomycetes bacterium]|nr:heparinase II/III family protein [Planctomycetota bacterium]